MSTHKGKDSNFHSCGIYYCYGIYLRMQVHFPLLQLFALFSLP